jgi:hypothetical protein
MASLEAGRQLADRYVLQERLGDGGHAEVWAALDSRDGQLVALKFLHLLSCSVEEALQVLRHESRMVRRLEHPGVLRVEEPQRDGDYVFLPVEYASGGSAANLRGAPWQRLLPVLLQVARVLEHAHSRGVVHRDIKPGNVLFDAAGKVRVADFGTSARTGSSETPADGSPFSASPQQLRGEAANPADDVYGLGALTYELLTRYPPFYPHFDAVRVQTQDPARPAPVHPAPATVLDLAQAMLARDAAARPSLAAVVAEFERSLEMTVAPEEGSVVIEASTPNPSAPGPARSLRGTAWWGLGAAVVAAAAVVLTLPQPEPAAPLPELGAAAAPIRVADAIVVEPVAGVEPGTPGTVETAAAGVASAAAPEDAAAAAPLSLADALQTGQQALDEYRPAQARAAFQRALALQADHPEAMAGLAAAARQQDLLAKLAEGTRAEAAGDPVAARDRYRLLLANQPDFAPAGSALARVEARLADQAFEDHLAAAAGAMRAGRVSDAADAYSRAAAIHPREARVLDGQQRVAEIQRDHQNALDLATGTTLEEGERWDQAIVHYRAVLERMPSLQFAQEGLARSERRAALDQELADYLARPERLAAPAVRQAAQRAMARGEASATGAPRLRTQLVSLQAVLDEFNQPVRVAITSDNSTRVSVTQVGELGVFQARELSLPPGKYTFIGRRDGFRDVRLELSLAPGQRVTALSVQCTERI